MLPVRFKLVKAVRLKNLYPWHLTAMKRTIILTGMVLSLLVGLMALPASSAPPFFGDDEFPAMQNSQALNDRFAQPVFQDNWRPFDDSTFSNSFWNDRGPHFQPPRQTPPDDDSQTQDPSQPGCQPGEIHIPEDQDCDGEIDDRFIGDDPVDQPGDGTTPPPADDEPGDGQQPPADDEPGDGTGVSEEEYVASTPEPGDYYFEAQGDGWISYVNPRDEYNPAYESRSEAPGSGKVCMALLNENGDPVVGESIPGTQASMDMGGLSWHSEANPFTVSFPMTTNYERPLDSDQFGTSSSVPQGDGYLDTHCFEFHQVPADHTITYDPVEITGQYADDVEVVGYYDQTGTWNSNFDPESDVSPYGTGMSSDGTVTMSPGNSHAEVLVVLQLAPS